MPFVMKTITHSIKDVFVPDGFGQLRCVACGHRGLTPGMGLRSHTLGKKHRAAKVAAQKEQAP